MVNLTGGLVRAGCALRYADSGGSGDAVVLTHGAGADHHMFDAQFEAMAASGQRAVVWDMRAHGKSIPNGVPFTAELALQDLSALVEHLDLSHPVLAGHSLGGNLSQSLVRRERLLLKLAAPALSIIPGWSLPAMMARASAMTPEARSDATRAFSQMTKKQFVDVWKATVLFVDPDPSYRTPIPVCLIRGSQDRTGNIATAMPRWADTEGVTEHVVPGAGHLVTQDAPDALTAILQSFLASIPNAA